MNQTNTFIRVLEHDIVFGALPPNYCKEAGLQHFKSAVLEAKPEICKLLTTSCII